MNFPSGPQSPPRRAYVAESDMQAHLFCNLLAEEGIKADVAGADSDLEGPPEIWVNASDYERACRLLAGYKQVERSTNRRPVQFGLLALIMNTAVLSMMFAFFKIAKGRSNDLIFPMVFLLVFGNLFSLAWHRRKFSR